MLMLTPAISPRATIANEDSKRGCRRSGTKWEKAENNNRSPQVPQESVICRHIHNHPYHFLDLYTT